MEKRTYKFGKSYLNLIFGDITNSDSDVLVSSDDYELTMGGGVSAAILRAAGEPLLIDAAKKTPAKLGDVVVTTAGALPAEHIFHIITIGPGEEELESNKLIEMSTTKCLKLLQTLGLNSIAFPAIGAGIAGFSYEDVSVQMAKVMSSFLKECDQTLHVSIYLYDRFHQKRPIDFLGFFEQFAMRLGSKSEPFDTMKEPHIIKTTKTTTEPKRITVTKSLSELTQERDAIEKKLAELGDSIDAKTTANLKKRLETIHQERLKLLSQLQEETAKEGVQVFISYSHEDIKYQKQLKAHLRPLERTGLITSWHDRMIKPGSEWKGQIDDNLNNADVVLLLISASFIESEYAFDIELKRALERHDDGDALVIPILIRPVAWHDLDLARLQVLPTDGKPVSTWDDQDLAWVDVAEGLKTAIQDLLSRKIN